VLKLIVKMLRNFLWRGVRWEYDLLGGVAWRHVCQPKAEGGLRGERCQIG